MTSLVSNKFAETETIIPTYIINQTLEKSLDELNQTNVSIVGNIAQCLRG